MENPFKDAHDSDANRAADIAQDLTAQWPFVERRKVERRQGERRRGDRRRAATQPGPPSLDYVALECTDREREIVDLLLQGMTNKQIATTLGIAVDTVKKHLQHVYKKLGVRRRVLLIADRSSTR